MQHLPKSKELKSKMIDAGQGAMEYLLILGAALLVVAIVTIAITSVVSSGQTQTTSGSDSAFDSLHDLAVGGIGYQIDLNLADFSSPQSFPAPPTLVCPNNPNFQTCNTEMIVSLFIDGSKVVDFNLTGVNFPKSKIFSYNFKGDPNVSHTLYIAYTDCYNGGGNCNDGQYWDKNLKFLAIKIRNSNGKEQTWPEQVFWSTYSPTLTFQ
jgi:hypothetical protein